MSVETEEFKAALSRFASGVTVVTTRDAAGKLHGLTVSAFCSVSLDPPLVLVCIEKATASHYAFAESGEFTASILSESQAGLSEHFATELANKFDEIATMETSNGLPAIHDASAVLECSIRFMHDGGDHTIFVGEVEKVSINDHAPLVYFRGDYKSISK